MNETRFVLEIVSQIHQNTQFEIALIGLIGTVTGSVVTIGSTIVLHWLKTRKESSFDKARKGLLTKMVNAEKWRRLSTLSRVIGADKKTTRRLLIEIGARSSEKQREDSDEVWGLISKHPITAIEDKIN